MTEQPTAPAQGPAEDAGPAPRGQCAACVIIKVVVFAGFVAYVAADFATGGKITGWLLAWLPRLPGGRGGDDT